MHLEPQAAKTVGGCRWQKPKDCSRHCRCSDAVSSRLARRFPGVQVVGSFLELALQVCI
jgi:hypothetical protein